MLINRCWLHLFFAHHVYNVFADNLLGDVNVMVISTPRIEHVEVLSIAGHSALRITPNFFDVYAEWGPNYVFSGHNHGGIVRLPALGGLISTEHKLLPKYSYGCYELGKTKMILSSGAGSHTIKFRLFNPVEIVTVEL